MLKPFAKDFYDYIILNIIDGLGGDNWIIKNSCMLLFSKLIKNNFALDSIVQKGIPTFIEYFTNKEILKNKIFQILKKEAEIKNNECNDCLILLISFFSKLKSSKSSEINEPDLIKFLNILFELQHKNNKIFRKNLGKVIMNLFGENQHLCYMKIIKYFDDMNNLIIKNNQLIELNSLDFHLNLLKELQINHNFYKLKKNIKSNDIDFESENRSNKNNDYQENIIINIKKIYNTNDFEIKKFMMIKEFIFNLENKISNILDNFNNIFLNDMKNNDNSEYYINQKNIFLNYFQTKSKNNKKLILAFFLLIKKITKFLIKSNEFCKKLDEKTMFENISNKLQNNFNFVNKDNISISKNFFFGTIEKIESESIIIFDFDLINKILEINIKNPFFYKAQRNLFLYYDNIYYQLHKTNSTSNEKSKNHLEIKNFQLEKLNFKNQELILFFFKKFSNSILSIELIYKNALFCFDIFDNKNGTKEIKLNPTFKININIFSKILDFFNKNINNFDINTEKYYELILKMFEYLKSNIHVTKIIKSVLVSISKIMNKLVYSNKYNEIKYNQYDLISQTLDIIQDLCLASNEEKTRFSSLISLENLIEYIICITKNDGYNGVINYLIKNRNIDKDEKNYNNNLIKFINIFIYIFNDEHPEIRSYAVKIFTNFNSFVKLVTLNKSNRISNFSKDNLDNNCVKFSYNSEFIFKKLLKFNTFFINVDLDYNNPIFERFKISFFESIYKQNFYFSKSRAQLNNNNKIFYYEPDNRYLDNIEITSNLLKQIQKIRIKKLDLLEKYVNILKQEKNSKLLSNNIKIMEMLENFIFYFTDNFEKIYFKLEEISSKTNKEDYKEIFKNIRLIIY